jgi:hypothetical protein
MVIPGRQPAYVVIHIFTNGYSYAATFPGNNRENEKQ